MGYEYLTLALPKGRLFHEVIELLRKAGVVAEDYVIDESRKLLLTDPVSKLRFILAKPVDVPTYVEYGAADLGVVGKDILLESERTVCELLDLGLGYCRLIVAVAQKERIRRVEDLDFNSRVATKFPRIATRYFNNLGIQVEVVKLNGSIELGPIVGLADAIVDITSTGQTLKENGLIPIAEIGEATARLIANRVSFKVQFERIMELRQRLAAVLPKKERNQIGN